MSNEKHFKKVIQVVYERDFDSHKIALKLAQEHPDLFLKYNSEPDDYNSLPFLEKIVISVFEDVDDQDPPFKHNSKIRAIKRVREVSEERGYSSTSGLKQAKEYVEEIIDKYNLEK